MARSSNEKKRGGKKKRKKNEKKKEKQKKRIKGWESRTSLPRETRFQFGGVHDPSAFPCTSVQFVVSFIFLQSSRTVLLWSLSLFL